MIDGATHPLEDLGDDTGAALVQLARALHLKNAELQPTLDAIIAHAVATIEPAEHAGLILLVARPPRSRRPPSASRPHLLDLLAAADRHWALLSTPPGSRASSRSTTRSPIPGGPSSRSALRNSAWPACCACRCGSTNCDWGR